MTTIPQNGVTRGEVSTHFVSQEVSNLQDLSAKPSNGTLTSSSKLMSTIRGHEWLSTSHDLHSSSNVSSEITEKSRYPDYEHTVGVWSQTISSTLSSLNGNDDHWPDSGSGRVSQSWTTLMDSRSSTWTPLLTQHSETTLKHVEISAVTVTVFGVFFLLVGLVGLVSNVILCIMLLSSWRHGRTRKRPSRQPTGLIFNMAVADMLFAFVSIMRGLTCFDSEFWSSLCVAMTTSCCSVVDFVECVQPMVISLTIVAIAETRHRTVTAYTPTPTVQTAKIANFRTTAYVGVIWIVSMASCAPIAVLPGAIALPCGVHVDSPTRNANASSSFASGCCVYLRQSIVYGIFLTLISYVIPVAVVGFLYTRIVIHVRRSGIRVGDVVQHATADRDVKVRGRQLRHDVRLARMFIALCAAFSVCYVPMIIALWIDSPQRQTVVLYDLRQSFGILFSTAPLSNVLIYCAFRRGNTKES